MQEEHATSGGHLVILESPKAGFNFTIDVCTWKTGPIFRGIKMIPPGIHMFSVSLGDTGPKQSFFKEFKAGQVIAFQYNADAEEIYELPEKARRTLEWSILELDPYLGPYPQESLSQWESLSYRISMECLKEIIPSLSFDQMTSSYLAAIDNAINHISNETMSSFEFTQIDLKRSFPDDAVGRERTLMSLDKSHLLESFLKDNIYEERWLGEFQLAFLIVVLGHNFEGFEQWKRMIELVSKAMQSISTRPLFFRSFLATLTAQLSNCPVDFFADLLDTSCNIAGYFRDLYAGCIDKRELMQVAEAFAKQVQASFGWHLDQEFEAEDEQPVIVDF